MEEMKQRWWIQTHLVSSRSKAPLVITFKQRLSVFVRRERIAFALRRCRRRNSPPRADSEAAARKLISCILYSGEGGCSALGPPASHNHIYVPLLPFFYLFYFHKNKQIR